MSKLEDLILAVEVRSLRFIVVLMLSMILCMVGINMAMNVWRLYVLDAQVKTLTEENRVLHHRLDVERTTHGEPL